MKTIPLHLIEPTLFDHTGHSLGYVTTLAQASSDFEFEFHVWLDKRGQGLLDALPVTPHGYFHRRWRRFQKFFLFKKLLRQPGKVFISTAEHMDLKFLDWLLPKGDKQLTDKVYCHFHQYTPKPKKLAELKTIAARHPEIKILATTQGLIQIFQDAGFANTQVIPCPTLPRKVSAKSPPSTFGKVIYAGAARADKGFPEVVNLISYMRQSGHKAPFEIQVSPPHSQRYDAKSEIALQKLEQLPKDQLTLHYQSLTPHQYQHLFEQSICLLLYDPQGYADKFSGVALDAFYAGAPVIAPAGTWMGEITAKYQAGVVLNHYAPNQVAKAIEHIKKNYADFQEKAKQAAIDLAEIHHPKHTLMALL